jgi:hypothetical protein
MHYLSETNRAGSPSGHAVLNIVGNFLANRRQFEELVPAQCVFGLFGQLSVFCCFVPKIVVEIHTALQAVCLSRCRRARFARQDRMHSGIHPPLLTFGNDASAAEATSLEGHERRGRRVFDWENQLQVYGRFHGFDDLIGPLQAQDVLEAASSNSRCQRRGIYVIYTLA